MAATEKRRAVVSAYQLALSSLPTHYGAWQAYGDFLAADASVSPEQWREYVTLLSDGLRQHPEPAWMLIGEHLASATADMGRVERRDYVAGIREALQAEDDGESAAIGKETTMKRSMSEPDMDTYGYVFDPAAIHGEAMRLVDQRMFKQAEATITGMLYDPEIFRLTVHQVQQIHLILFDVYRRWPGHQQQRFAVARDIVDLDETTHTGIGAEGYLLVNHLGGVTLTHGWVPQQVQVGTNVWDIAIDVAHDFDHGGSYQLTLSQVGGKGAITIREVALLHRGEVLNVAEDPGKLAGEGSSVAANLRLPVIEDDRSQSLQLRVDYVATSSDSRGRFEVFPLLE